MWPNICKRNPPNILEEVGVTNARKFNKETADAKLAQSTRLIYAQVWTQVPSADVLFSTLTSRAPTLHFF